MYLVTRGGHENFAHIVIVDDFVMLVRFYKKIHFFSILAMKKIKMDTRGFVFFDSLYAFYMSSFKLLGSTKSAAMGAGITRY
jgi:hypothetical protein